MSLEDTVVPEAEERMEEAVLAYMQAGGRPPDRHQLLDDYPDLASELLAFFAEEDRLAMGLSPLLAEPRLPADDRLKSFGNYQVLEEIGRGMDVVYKACQKNPNRIVAIKLLQRFGPGEVQRFLNDAQYMADLEHPHIVPVYEVGEHEGKPYFSMKLMEGGSLAKRLSDFQLPVAGEGGAPAAGSRPTGKQRKMMNMRQTRIARLLATVAEAVHYAHQRGLLHRDLKPGNILLDDKKQPHVTDFGLAVRLAAPGDEPAGGTPSYMAPEQARAYQQVRSSHGIAGASNYMAPEQAAGQKSLTTAVDIYGLGAVLYELLTGKAPFRGKDLADTLEQVRNQPPLPPRRVQPLAARDLEAICLKCLQKDPAQRYASARELARDLRRYLAGEPVRARPARAGERLAKWSRRKPGIALLTAAILFVTFVGSALVIWHWRNAVVSLEKAEKLLYVNGIDRAERLLSSGQRNRTEEILQQCPKHLRHWEWHYLKRWDQPEAPLLHDDLVKSVIFSPNGKTLATADDDGKVHLWDADSRKKLEILKPRAPCAVKMVTFSPDGKRLASAAENRTVTVWDLEIRRQMDFTQAGILVTFHPDGKHLISAGRGEEVKVWDSTTGKMAKSLKHQVDAECLAISPEGEWLVVGGRGDPTTVAVLNLRTRAEMDPGKFFPKGIEFRAQDFIYALAFLSKTSGLIAIKNQAHVWHQDKVLSLPGFTGRCSSLAVSARGEHVAASFSTGSTGSVMLWEAKDGKRLFSCQQFPLANCVAPSPDGKRLAIARGKEVTVENLPDQPNRPGHRKLEQAGRVLAFDPESKNLLIAQGDKVFEWDLAQAKARARVSLQGLGNRLALHPNGRLLAGPGEKNTVCLWNLETGKKFLSLSGHKAPLTVLAFSPNGEKVAAAARDRSIKVWETTAGQLLFSLPAQADEVLSLALSADGKRLASSCRDWKVKIWDLSNQNEANEPLSLDGHEKFVSGVSFSRDGRWLASAGADTAIKIWDARIGKEVQTLHGHTGAVVAALFSPDGQRLFSAGEDGIVKIWNTTDGQELLSLTSQQKGIIDLVLSPDGGLLATGNSDGSVNTWDGRPLEDPPLSKNEVPR